MFHSWLKYRPILILHIATQGSKAQPQHGKGWNALLAAEYLSRVKNNQQLGDRTKEREALRNEMICFLGGTKVEEEVQIVDKINPNTLNSSWHGIPSDNLTPAHYEQILWELAEINFQFEFQALDRRA